MGGNLTKETLSKMEFRLPNRLGSSPPPSGVSALVVPVSIPRMLLSRRSCGAVQSLFLVGIMAHWCFILRLSRNVNRAGISMVLNIYNCPSLLNPVLMNTICIRMVQASHGQGENPEGTLRGYMLWSMCKASVNARSMTLWQTLVGEAQRLFNVLC